MSETSVVIEKARGLIKHLDFHTEDPEGEARLACNVKVELEAVPAEFLECVLVGGPVSESEDDSPRWMPVDTLYDRAGAPKFLMFPELRFSNTYKEHVCTIGSVYFSEAKVSKLSVKLCPEKTLSVTCSLAVYPEDETVLTKYLNGPVTVSIEPKNVDAFRGADDKPSGPSRAEQLNAAIADIYAMNSKDAEKAIARLDDILILDAVKKADKRATVKAACEKRVRAIQEAARRGAG